MKRQLTRGDSWVRRLKLTPHPEGGYYREFYRSREKIRTPRGIRNAATAIYFFLPPESISALHRIKADEIWHFYAGAPLGIWMLDPETGKAVMRTLGQGQFQVTVPAGRWFGAYGTKAGAGTLSGCTVSPGFDFGDFELGRRAKLLKKFPGHSGMIRKLTRP